MPDDLEEADEEIQRHLEVFQRRFDEARRALEEHGRGLQQEGQTLQQNWQVVERQGRTIWRRESSTTTSLEPAQRQIAVDTVLDALRFPVLPPLPPFPSLLPPTKQPPAAPPVEPPRSLWERLEEADAETVAPSSLTAPAAPVAVPQAAGPLVLAQAVATAPRRTARGPSEGVLVVIAGLCVVIAIGALVLLR